MGPDNRNPAWREDTTPRDVMDAIVMREKHLSTGGAKRRPCVAMQQLGLWKATRELFESITVKRQRLDG